MAIPSAIVTVQLMSLEGLPVAAPGASNTRYARATFQAGRPVSDCAPGRPATAVHRLLLYPRSHRNGCLGGGGRQLPYRQLREHTVD